MAESKLSPLQYNVALVNPDGTPTPYFIQLLQQLYEEKKITDDAVDNGIIAGAGLSGGGSLTAGPVTLSADVQAILNLVSSTRGAILYRGASAWSALLPGAAGNVLTAHGTGTDPTWDPAAGGSSTPWYWSPPLASRFTLSNGGGATNMILTDNTDEGLIIEPSATYAAGALSHAFALENVPGGATANFTLTARFQGSSNNEFEYNGMGLCLQESSTGKFIAFFFMRSYGNLGSIAVDYMNSASSFNSDQRIMHGVMNLPWRRIVHTGGNYLFQVSNNGKRWITIITLGDTAFLATRADKIGLVQGCARNTDLYWQYTCQNYSIV